VAHLNRVAHPSQFHREGWVIRATREPSSLAAATSQAEAAGLSSLFSAPIFYFRGFPPKKRMSSPETT
jgi:hypothetical protein